MGKESLIDGRQEQYVRVAPFFLRIIEDSPCFLDVPRNWERFSKPGDEAHSKSLGSIPRSLFHILSHQNPSNVRPVLQATA